MIFIAFISSIGSVGRGMPPLSALVYICRVRKFSPSEFQILSLDFLMDLFVTI